MSPALARLLTRLYPLCWRERYGEEFQNLLLEGDENIGTVANVVACALREHIDQTPGLRNCVDDRAPSKPPWLVFGLAPLLFLFLGYSIACLILWSGWRLLLPGSPTPFVPIEGAGVFYFGVGRMLYFGAPFLIGWVVAFLSSKLRPRAGWPVLGLLMVALIGGAAHVNASRTPVGAVEKVGMDFSLLPIFHGNGDELLHSLLILALTGVPLIFLRSRLLIAPGGNP